VPRAGEAPPAGPLDEAAALAAHPQPDAAQTRRQQEDAGPEERPGLRLLPRHEEARRQQRQARPAAPASATTCSHPDVFAEPGWLSCAVCPASRARGGSRLSDRVTHQMVAAAAISVPRTPQPMLVGVEWGRSRERSEPPGHAHAR